ncbi:MAG TPA: SDR family NAD(P)-dependent oxidoreductase [Burkholderiales bacterium]|nr:SDR family NAD(P)-dependent oxidoreductase [Burkholderiales bacterium]
MTERQLERVVAIVTGASGGIAAGIARALAREGARVALVSRSLERTERIARDIEAAGGAAAAFAADVTRADDVLTMVAGVLQRWGHVDVLVNGVGGFHGKASIEEITEAQWDEVMALNMKSAFLCAQAVARPMKARRSGRIINIGSQAASGPNPHANSFLPYGAAKAGLIGFTKHLAKELGPFGITVNAVSPGLTLTERAKKNRDAATLQRIVASTPLRTVVEPEDTAAAVVFLASAAGRYITGVNLNVNAGAAIL